MNAEQLKNSILQHAVEGKLVEQRPEEGTAAELLREIKVEKARLVKEGKLKKEKPLPEIKAEEIPFEIPESWEWVRLRDIVYNRGQEKPSKHFVYIDIGSIDNKRQQLGEKETIIAPDKAPSRARKIVDYGDIIYSTVRPYLHNICIIDKHFSRPPIASTGFAVMTTYQGVLNKFLFHYLLSPQFDSYANSNQNAKGVAYPAINDKAFYSAPVPLPPLAEQKRIVAKIEELLPHVERYGKAHDELTALNTKFPEAMKKSVLQYAMEGKLVEQRAEEGTAKELLKEIKAEKARLVVEGKLKKEKPLPEIKAEEIPFEIPESWEWVRLGEICVSIADGDHQPPPQTQTGVPFLVISNVSSGKLSFNNTRFVPVDYYNALQYGRVPEKSDILFTVTGSYGIPVLIDTDRAFCFQRHISLLKLHKINECFFVYWLSSSLIKAQCDLLATGTAQKTLSLGSLKSLLLPLPPLAEQKRIVAKIEELLSCCGALGNESTA